MATVGVKAGALLAASV